MSKLYLYIIKGDNISILPKINNIINLIYIDPPFNTQKVQKLHQQISIGGDPYHVGNQYSYRDDYTDYTEWLMARIRASIRLLKPSGSFFLHLDHRSVHKCKLLMDDLMGEDHFMNEIIWSYDYGGRSRNRWPLKHDTILWYVKNKDNYIYNYDKIDRIPYMAPGLVGAEKAKRGKTPTDVWWNTIVPTNGSERTGYPTQKPLSILERIILVHSKPKDVILDFFAGSGTTGEAAIKHKRKAILIDNNPEAIEVMSNRFRSYKNIRIYKKSI